MKSFALVSLVLMGLTSCQAAPASLSCGGSSSKKEILLSAPTTVPVVCQYTVKDYSKNVCQLRIDFAMTLAQPSLITDHVSGLVFAECRDDIFAVNGYKFCGVETNQHIYVPFNRTAGITSVDLSVTTANRAGGINLPKPTWSILITQLECPSGGSIRSGDLMPESRASTADGFLVAPVGCLQYFPYLSGVLTSFNLNGGLGVYPANMNYAVCFRRQSRTLGVQLKSTILQLGTVNGNAGSLQTDNSCFANNQSGDRNVDYLSAPQASLWERDLRATYFCGNSAKAVTIRSTTPGPLYVIFNSDGIYKQNEAGFSFNYNIL